MRSKSAIAEPIIATRDAFEIWPPSLDIDTGLSKRIGLLALANDVVIEGEMRRMIANLPIGLHVARVAMPSFGSVEALGALRDHLGAAMENLVPRNRLDVVAFGCTSASAIIGEDEVIRLIQQARGSPILCTNPVAAAARCLEARGAKRIALLSPYPELICAITIEFLRSRGFEVVRTVSFDTVGDENISRISSRSIAEAVTVLADEPSDAIFVSCTALRVVDLIEPLEAATGRLLVTSNQALLADALDLMSSTCAPTGFGRIFALPEARLR